METDHQQLFIDLMGTIGAVVSKMSKPDAENYVEALAIIAHEYIRHLNGDEYTAGFLEGAMNKLDSPPLFQQGSVQ